MPSKRLGHDMKKQEKKEKRGKSEMREEEK
jgi:hypothetical protein